MTSGRNTQLTKLVGEYLVAAELARRGLFAATFSGNVPELDIVTSGPNGDHVPVQVKAKASGGWQLDISDFADIVMEGDRQIVKGIKTTPYPGLVFVFVNVGDYGSDQFFVIDWISLASLIMKNYVKYLDKHGGRRPKNPKSIHTALDHRDLMEFKDRWDQINGTSSE